MATTQEQKSVEELGAEVSSSVPCATAETLTEVIGKKQFRTFGQIEIEDLLCLKDAWIHVNELHGVIRGDLLLRGDRRTQPHSDED